MDGSQEETMNLNMVGGTNHQQPSSTATTTKKLIRKKKRNQVLDKRHRANTTSTLTNANRRMYGVALASSHSSSGAANRVTKEREEADCKGLYEKALLFQTRDELDSALWCYMKLLENQHVADAVMDDECCFSDLVVPVDNRLTLAEKTVISTNQLQQNVFLFIKYLSLKNVAVILQKQKKFVQACSFYSKALQIDDTDAAVWFNFGQCAYNCLDYSLARMAFEYTLKYSPKHPLALVSLMEVLYIIGDYGDCEWITQKVLAQDPSYDLARAIYNKCTFDTYNQQWTNEVLKNLDAKASASVSDGAEISVPISIDQSSCSVLSLPSNATWESLLLALTKLYNERCDKGSDLNGAVILQVDNVPISQPTSENLQHDDSTNGDAQDSVDIIDITNDTNEQSVKRKRRRTANNDESDNRQSKRNKLAPALSAGITEILVLDAEEFVEDKSTETLEVNNCKTLESQNLELFVETFKHQTPGLLDLSLKTIEQLCSHLSDSRISKQLKHCIFTIYERLISHNYQLPASSCLKLIELYYSEAQADKDQQYKRSFITARKILSSFSIDLICGRRADLSSIFNDSQLIALNWLAALIQYALHNSAISKSHLLECLRLIENHPLQRVILPQLNDDWIVTRNVLLTKLKEFDVDKSLSKARVLSSSLQYKEALQLFSGDTLSKINNEATKNSALTTIFEILADIKPDDQMGLDARTILSIATFVLSAVDEDFIENRMRRVKRALHFLVTESSGRDFSICPSSVRVLVVKHILRVLDYLQGLREDNSMAVLCLILLYRIAVFKSEFCRYSFLPFTRLIMLKFFRSHQRKKLLFNFLIQELYHYHKIAEAGSNLSIKENYDNIRKEVLNVIYVYYGVKLTTDLNVFKNDDGKEYIEHELQDNYAKLSRNTNHCAIAFYLIRHEAEESFNTNQQVRKEIEKVLILIHNGFRWLPTACDPVREGVFELLDSANETLNDPVLTLPTLDLSTEKYADVYTSIYYLVGLYIAKNVSASSDLIPPILTEPSNNQSSFQFSQSIYFLVKACICAPKDSEAWSQLSLKYRTLVDSMIDIADLTYEHERILKNKDVRRHLRLSEDASFRSDIHCLAGRALQASKIAIQIDPEDENSLIGLCLLLYSLLKLKFFNFDKASLLSQCTKYLTLGMTKHTKDWRYSMLLGLIRSRTNPEDAKGYLDLLMQAYQLSLNSTKTSVLPLYHLQRERLRLLVLDESRYISIVSQYMFDSNVATKKMKKGGVGYLEQTPGVLSFIDTNSSEASEPTRVWTNVVTGFASCLRVSQFHHKSLFRLSECLSQGPWHEWNKAELLFSTIIKKRQSQGDKPATFEYKLWVDDNEIISYKHLNFRKWRNKCTRLFVKVLRKTKNLEAFSMLYAGLKKKIDTTDLSLTSCAKFALQMFAKVVLDKLGPNPNSTDQMALLRYLCELLVYSSDTFWANDTDGKIKKLVRILESAIRKCNAFSVFTPNKSNVQAAIDFAEATYKIDLSTGKGKKKAAASKEKETSQSTDKTKAPPKDKKESKKPTSGTNLQVEKLKEKKPKPKNARHEPQKSQKPKIVLAARTTPVVSDSSSTGSSELSSTTSAVSSTQPVNNAVSSSITSSTGSSALPVLTSQPTSMTPKPTSAQAAPISTVSTMTSNAAPKAQRATQSKTTTNSTAAPVPAAHFIFHQYELNNDATSKLNPVQAKKPYSSLPQPIATATPQFQPHQYQQQHQSNPVQQQQQQSHAQSLYNRPVMHPQSIQMPMYNYSSLPQQIHPAYSYMYPQYAYYYSSMVNQQQQQQQYQQQYQQQIQQQAAPQQQQPQQSSSKKSLSTQPKPPQQQ